MAAKEFKEKFQQAGGVNQVLVSQQDQSFAKSLERGRDVTITLSQREFVTLRCAFSTSAFFLSFEGSSSPYEYTEKLENDVAPNAVWENIQDWARLIMIMDLHLKSGHSSFPSNSASLGMSSQKSHYVPWVLNKYVQDCSLRIVQIIEYSGGGLILASIDLNIQGHWAFGWGAWEGLQDADTRNFKFATLVGFIIHGIRYPCMIMEWIPQRHKRTCWICMFRLDQLAALGCFLEQVKHTQFKAIPVSPVFWFCFRMLYWKICRDYCHKYSLHNFTEEWLQ